MQPISKSFFNEFVFFDIKTLDHARSGDYVGILIMIEGFSKLVTLAPIKSHESREIMSLIYTRYVCRWGAPLVMVSDRERSFLSTLANEYYSLMNVEKRSTVSHRPESDGQSEAYVKLTSKIMTAVFMTDNLDGQTDTRWHLRLPLVETAINSTPYL